MGGPVAGVEDREDAIGESGFGVLFRGPGSVLAVLMLMALLLVAGCGGGDQAKQAEPPPTPPEETVGALNAGDAKGDPKAAPGANTAGGATVQSKTNAETLEDTPFELNQRQPIPPDFRAAYQRRALIVVQFFKERPDTTRGIEFFAYDITNPGEEAEASEDLGRGEYGTLAAQLEVGYTPFVAMLAPRGEEYVIENLFQGYVDRGVLDQALFNLTRSDVGGNSSDIDVVLDRVELTESGGDIEYVTVMNQGDEEADLSGFSLRLQDPETGEVDDSGDGVRLDGRVVLAPGQQASIGRVAEVVDADGNQVVGTLSGGDALSIGAGDQVALLDNGGAVVDTITI